MFKYVFKTPVLLQVKWSDRHVWDNILFYLKHLSGTNFHINFVEAWHSKNSSDFQGLWKTMSCFWLELAPKLSSRI